MKSRRGLISGRGRDLAMVAVTLTAVVAHAVPGASSTATAADDPTAPRAALSNADGSNDAFRGVAQIEGLGSTCTGFLVDTGAGAAPAIVLTNGHCTGLFDATNTLTDVAPPEGAVVRFGKFIDTPDDVVEVSVAAIRYATMRATDIAVVELDATQVSLQDQGIVAYQLGPAPHAGDAIRVVGVPVDGVDADQQVLRGDTCTAGSTVRLVEFEWLWDTAITSDCAGILGGNSGSPVFTAANSSMVVAIVNTTTIGADPGGSCYLGQPCEIGAEGVAEVDNRTYAMPVSAWTDCFDSAGVLNPALGCPVEPAAQLQVSAPLRAVVPGAHWSATISAADWSGNVALKTGAAATTDCRDPAGYRNSRPLDDALAYDEPLPLDEDVYVLCAATVDDHGSPTTASAGYAVMQVDATPPTVDIDLVIRSNGGEATTVEPRFAPPELSSFLVKFGPRGSTDCAAEEGYAIYRRVPIFIPNDELPATVCVIGQDEAGNFGEPQPFDVP